MANEKGQSSSGSSTNSPSQGQQSSGVASRGQSGQQMTRGGQSGAMSRPGYGQPYFPSPAEMLSNPFAVMRRMHEDMDRIFSQAFGGGMMSGGAQQEAGSGMMSWAPAIEVRQQGNDLVVHAELPGLKPEEVQVEVNEDALIIQGERRQDQSSDQSGVHRTERRYGRFYRAIPLPEGVDADQAKAAFNHGVLEVTVPLPQQQSRRRQIPVTGTGSGASTQGATQQSGAAQGTSSTQGNTGSQTHGGAQGSGKST